jgi:hypothetical protein
MTKILLFVALMLGAGLAQAEEAWALVVHKDNPVASMKARDAVRMFLGQKAYWADGKRVRIVVGGLSDPAVKGYIEGVVKKKGNDFRNHWMTLTLSGKAQAAVLWPLIAMRWRWSRARL